MARNRMGARVSRGTPRKKIWARQVNINAAVAIGAAEHFNADLLAPLRTQMGLTANPLGLTVIRIRGRISMIDTSGGNVGLVGIRTYTRGAADPTADLLAVDGPGTDPHADWMAFETLYNSAGSDDKEFDVRAMRKLEEASSSLVISFQTPDELGGSFRYSVSVLAALP